MALLRLNVDGNGDENHDALYDQLIKVGNTQQIHTVVDDANDERADQRAGSG